MASYPFRQIESKWQSLWAKKESFAFNAASSKPKTYVLEMFPYPSGHLHMGHVRNYAIGDVIARYLSGKGYEVLHPMGWDAFGLPAENAAIQNKTSPKEWTLRNIDVMRDQLKSLGLSLDWTRELATCLPNYYGHEQKIFQDLYKKGLIYRTESWVNWDPVDHSVLANEQVINGRGWRSGALVEKRKLMQWSVKITAYAQELLDDLKTLDGWPEKVVKMQENWIGRSEGALVHFRITGTDQHIDVFTTRPDTLFGASFCALSVNHPCVEAWAAHNPDLAAFIRLCQQTPTTEEALSTAEKLGFNTGLTVDHPFVSGQTLPIFVANFVLSDYGTGALFGCPAHDERDHEFATKYQLPILPVVSPFAETTLTAEDLPYTGDGILIHSGFLTGQNVADARRSAIDHLEKNNIGEGRITYRLRDWCVSRQRYWGCPIPVIHCPSCGPVLVPGDQLPVTLPDDVSFDKPGNPLEHHPTWKHTSCPTCHEPACRETDTLDTFMESSWYFLRFCAPHGDEPVHTATANELLPVQWYIGGIEHAVLHLLYARFFTKALRDCGYITHSEPFKNLLTQGMVCHQTFKDEDGQWVTPDAVEKTGQNTYVSLTDGRAIRAGRSEKMSKSKKNVVDPKEIIETYGVDAARLFMLSDNPPERDFDWSAEGIEGSWRFINRLWRLGTRILERVQTPSTNEAGDLPLRQLAHQMLAKWSEAYERQSFHKVIAFARELTNALEQAVDPENVSISTLRETLDILLLGLTPVIPHVTSELRAELTDIESALAPTWAQPDPTLIATTQVTIAVQVNGKMRGSFEIEVDAPESTVLEKALELPSVVRDITGKTIKKQIIVPNRIVNLVVGG